MSANNSHYVQGLWNDWVENSDNETANELMQHYMYIVHFHVERIASYIPESFDKKDLKSLGLMGLFDALHKFDPNRNLKFDTYATIRVRGAIIDGLRKEDWLPRTLRDEAKKIEKVSEELEQRLKRTPNSTDIANELDMDPEEVETIINNTLFSNIISLETTLTTSDTDDSTISSTIEDHQSVLPDEHVLDIELKDELAEGIKQLNENEQMVISLFYVEELTLTEIGEVLNLTTSRISQIHKKAIFKLKNILKKMRVSV